eukprot:Opistho-1_new@89667
MESAEVSARDLVADEDAVTSESHVTLANGTLHEAAQDSSPPDPNGAQQHPPALELGEWDASADDLLTSGDPSAGVGEDEEGVVEGLDAVDVSEADVSHDVTADGRLKLAEGPFTPQQRNRLVRMADAYQVSGNTPYALQCYVAALKDLRSSEGFVLLPKCLGAIAQLYYDAGDFERAVHFRHAEKVYYEKALIDAVGASAHAPLAASPVALGDSVESAPSELEAGPVNKHSAKDEGEKRGKAHADGVQESSDGVDDAPVGHEAQSPAGAGAGAGAGESLSSDLDQYAHDEALAPFVRRARDLDRLAELCLSEGRPELALEYVAQSITIRQKYLGDVGASVEARVGLLGVAYAESGRKQYTDALRAYIASREAEGSEAPHGANSPSATAPSDPHGAQDEPPPIGALTEEDRRARFFVFFFAFTVIVAVGSAVFLLSPVYRSVVLSLKFRVYYWTQVFQRLFG